MIDLKKFCGAFGPSLCVPFTEGEYTYATCGRVIVRVPRVEGFLNFKGDVNMLFKLPWENSALPKFIVNTAGQWRGLTKVACFRCSGNGALAQCEKCGGEGEIECDLGHQHECRECGGDGVIENEGGEIICFKCNGSKETFDPDVVNAVLLGDGYFNPRFIELILTLPGLCVSAPKRSGATYFKFDGGDGLIMPQQFSGDENVIELGLVAVEGI